MPYLLHGGRVTNDRRCVGTSGRLHCDGQLYWFCYTQGARKLQGFRPFPPMDDLDQVYVSETLFPLFANRLLSPSRPEYEAFLRWGGFDPNNPPTPLAILGVTEGIRQTDSIEVFPCPTPDADGCYLNRFFLHGIRWMPATALERIDLEFLAVARGVRDEIRARHLAEIADGLHEHAEQHVGQHERSPGLQHPQRLAQELAARIEVKRRLDAHHSVGMPVRKAKPRSIHTREGTAGRACPGHGKLRLRNVDRGDIRGLVAAHEAPRGGAWPAGHIENAAALGRDPARQLVDQRLAGSRCVAAPPSHSPKL